MDCCRICYEEENLVNLCECKGSIKYLCKNCLKKYIGQCEICLTNFKFPFDYKSYIILCSLKFLYYFLVYIEIYYYKYSYVILLFLLVSYYRNYLIFFHINNPFILLILYPSVPFLLFDIILISKLKTFLIPCLFLVTFCFLYEIELKNSLRNGRNREDGEDGRKNNSFELEWMQS